jgi:hypothetical protein
MIGGGVFLGLFHPNLALDSHGTTLALEQRDWNALLGLGQRAGCLDPWLASVSGASSGNQMGDTYWSLNSPVTCQGTDAIVVPYDMPMSPLKSPKQRGTSYGVATPNDRFSTIRIGAWNPGRLRLENNGLLPLSLHELFVVLGEMYTQLLDELPATRHTPFHERPLLRATWLRVCKKLAIDHEHSPPAWCFIDQYYIPRNSCDARFQEGEGWPWEYMLDRWEEQAEWNEKLRTQAKASEDEQEENWSGAAPADT